MSSMRALEDEYLGRALMEVSSDGIEMDGSNPDLADDCACEFGGACGDPE